METERVLEDVGKFMEIIEAILSAIFRYCPILFSITCFFFCAWLILSALKCVGYHNGD